MKRPRHGRSAGWILLVLMVVFLTFPGAPQAATPSIQGLRLYELSESLVLSARLEEGFTEELQDSILGGIPVTFRYTIELRRKRSLWPDATLKSKVVEHYLEYDPLRKRFHYIFVDSLSAKVKTTVEFEEAKSWASRVEQLDLIQLVQLERGSRYYVRMKAEIKTSGVVFPFRFLLPFRYLKVFVPFLNRDVEWAQSEVYRP